MKYLNIVKLVLIVVMGAGCSGGVGHLDNAERKSLLAQKARLKVDAGDLEAGAELYKKALDEDPLLARLHLDLALVLHRMEEKNNYVGAIYHYQRYLELRPDSEKSKMIENRIRLASHAYAGKVLGSTHAGNQPIIIDLENQNRKLKEEIRLLEEKNGLLKKKILQRDSSEVEPVVLRGGKDEKTMPAAERTYRVQPGDTMESIAVFFYEDAGKARNIYDANKSTVKDPNSLIEGQVLIIP